MRIFVLIPVFNRVEHTRRVLEALYGQTLAQYLRIIVINDGSTDSTAEYLASQKDVIVLHGNGNLWWGGAIQLGLKFIHKQKPTVDDYVLFLNNDTWFDPEYIAILVEASISANGAAVGSAMHELGRNPSIVSIGPRIDIDNCRDWDVLSELSPNEIQNLNPVYQVDALSGRGTLYPAMLFERYGRMRPWLLPHYMSDYEVAMRFARKKVQLLVSTRAFVWSPPVYGNDISKMGFWKRAFSRRSSINIIHRICFYMLIGSPWQRLTAPFRLTKFFFTRTLNRWIAKWTLL